MHVVQPCPQYEQSKISNSSGRRGRGVASNSGGTSQGKRGRAAGSSAAALGLAAEHVGAEERR